MRSVVVLGSTGSVGTQALDVIRANPQSFRVVGLAAAGGNLDLLADQAREFDAEVVAVADPSAAATLQKAFASATPAPVPKVVVGPQAATDVAAWPCDVVLNAMTGSIGLAPTLAALRSGATLALANKESLIVGGPVVKAVAAPGQIVPVDSEHSALAQCLRGGSPDEVSRLILTASGGPFRGQTRSELRDVTVEQALAHPTWDMGPVVTINSATMVNKGLEVIEAHLLFDVPMDRIDVVVHPQSIVHSMVEFTDGSTLVQASPPDMRLPISLGLSWPDRVADAAASCDWTSVAQWNFQPLDDAEFPAVALARSAGSVGGTAPAVYNAVNEECVAAFMAGSLPFLGIVDTVQAVLTEHLATLAGPDQVERSITVDDVLKAEAWARARAHEVLAQRVLEEGR